jgi:hypothetical protein
MVINYSFSLRNLLRSLRLCGEKKLNNRRGAEKKRQRREDSICDLSKYRKVYVALPLALTYNPMAEVKANAKSRQ